MPGFIVSNMKNVNIDLSECNLFNRKLYFDGIKNKDFLIRRASLDSFRDDKIMLDIGNKIIVTEGVITNSADLIKKYNVDGFKELIDVLSDKNDHFFDEFKGSFSGAVYYKDINKWVFYTDQLGSHSLYYYFYKGIFIVASQLNYVTELLKKNDVQVKEDLHGLHCILDWGYLIDNATAIADVKRVYPGEYITLDEEIIRTKLYYISNFELKNKTIDDYIEVLDNAFTNAIKRIVNKSIENGYKTVLDISGGLDSRLIAYRAVELYGNNSFIGFHFSQDGSIEQKVAFEVIKKLNLESFYYMMDTSNFLTNMKTVMTLNNGSSYYMGVQAGLAFGEFVDSRVYGIEMTGALGDIRDSAMIYENGDNKPSLHGQYYKSNKLNGLNEYSNYSTVIKYFDTNDVFWTYLRGISAGMSTILAKQAHIEAMTPYGDIEFLEAYLSIPWSVRFHNKILLKWMRKKFPEASEMKYSQTNLPAKYTWTWRHINYNRIRTRLKFLLPKKNMLDLETWINDKDVVIITNEYYYKNIKKINDDLIRNKVKSLYTRGNALEKSIALSVLAIYDIYF